MAFEISALQYSELDEFVHVLVASFTHSNNSLLKLFYPGSRTDSVHAFMRLGPEKDLHDSNHIFFTIRDPSTKEIVGVGEWEIQHSPKSIESILHDEERARHEREAMTPVQGVNHVALNARRQPQAECHREIMQGQPHFYLHSLAVLPQHQRRGVGVAAMEWGLAKADELGLPVYLESSQAGRRLYERCGFKTDRVLPFDARDYGHSTLGENYCMVRGARKLNGV